MAYIVPSVTLPSSSVRPPRASRTEQNSTSTHAVRNAGAMTGNMAPTTRRSCKIVSASTRAADTKHGSHDDVCCSEYCPLPCRSQLLVVAGQQPAQKQCKHSGDASSEQEAHRDFDVRKCCAEAICLVVDSKQNAAEPRERRRDQRQGELGCTLQFLLPNFALLWITDLPVNYLQIKTSVVLAIIEEVEAAKKE